MATTNRNTLKTYFNEGDRPTEEQFSDLIDSNVNTTDDTAVLADVVTGTSNTKFVTAAVAKAAILQIAPVKKVNSISPDSNGNVSITNVNTAGTITGSITKAQVTGLQADLDAKQSLLVSGTNIKTINNVSVLGSGNIALGESLIAAPNAPFTLSNAAGLQNAFPSTCDTFTLLANKTYFFKGKYLITKDITTSHADAIGWTAGAGLNITSMEYVIHAVSAAGNSLTSASYHINASGTATRTVNTANVVPNLAVEFEGVLRCAAGGTLVPKISFSVAVTGSNIMRVGSYIEFKEIGSDSFEKTTGVG